MDFKKYADIIKQNNMNKPVDRISAEDMISATASCLLTGLIVPAVGLPIVSAWSVSNYIQTTLIITFGLTVLHMLFPKKLKDRFKKSRIYAVILALFVAVLSGSILASTANETLSSKNEKRISEIETIIQNTEDEISNTIGDRDLTNDEIEELNTEFAPLTSEYEELSNFDYQSKFRKDAIFSGIAGFLISMVTLASITTVTENLKKDESDDNDKKAGLEE